MIDASKWRDFLDVLAVGTFWDVKKRGEGGSAKYPGNFIPQIPENLITRFTCEGDLVVDLFAGSETTADVCERMNRRYEGSDLRPYSDRTTQADAREFDPSEQAQLTILHPPYANIIDYNTKLEHDSRDLSLDYGDFLQEFEQVAANAIRITKPKGYIALIISDIYQKGEHIPLGFRSMEKLQSDETKLKAIIVKNFGDEVANKGKNRNLWFFRALKGGFCVLEHEYIFLFRKE